MNTNQTPPVNDRIADLLANPDDTAALCIARGMSQRATAKASGLSLSTVRRRVADWHFQEHVKELQDELLAKSVAMLIGATSEAALTLRKLCRSGVNEFVRLAAARSILEFAGLTSKAIRDAELQARVSEIETALKVRRTQK